MTARRPGLVVERLTKRFGDRSAFEELSFEVGWGEIFGLLGPNGAGKTSAVRVLSTLLPATSGRAEVAGISLARGNEVEIRRRVSVVTDYPGLYLKLSVRDNLEFFAGLYGLPRRAAKARMDECAAAVGIEDRLDDFAGSLSRGLLQRAGLARALLPEPDLLFLDEPTTGLDPAAATDVREIISGLRHRGTTVFLTTHRLDKAEFAVRPRRDREHAADLDRDPRGDQGNDVAGVARGATSGAATRSRVRLRPHRRSRRLAERARRGRVRRRRP
jgi:ABC-2 type transport system ATP-binding protein